MRIVFQSIVWTFLFLNTALATEFDPVHLKSVAEGKYWWDLHHYAKTLFGGVTSEAYNSGFFLSPDGRSNPLEELKVSLDTFTQSQVKNPAQPNPQCLFPERFRYLKEEFSLKVPEANCPDFQEWKKRFAADSATLVFSAAFMGNPSSMYGHTFLRFDSRQRDSKKSKKDLLDYGVSYAADMGDLNPFVGAFLGLVGGLQGVFSQQPYFEKVREYTESESRDLWEYRLNLTPSQVNRMMNHVWELRSALFNYQFFDKNCAYQLLTLLEIGNPAWHLRDQFFFSVIPSDTLRVIDKIPGAVTEIHYRPSLFKQLSQKFNALSEGDKRDFHERKMTSSAALLDALSDQDMYDLMQTGKPPTDEWRSRQREILVARANSKDSPPPLPEIQGGIGPHLGNDSTKISGYGGSIAGRGYTGLQFRPAFHDLFDNDDGYVRDSLLTMVKTDVRFTMPDSTFHLNELEVIEITSFTPVNPITKRISWNVAAGLYSPPEINYGECLVGRVAGGAGYSAYAVPSAGNLLLYSMLNLNLEYSGCLPDSYRVGPSLAAGVLSHLGEKVKFGLTGEYFLFPFQSNDSKYHFKASGVLSWSVMHNLELRGSVSYHVTSSLGFFDSVASLGWYL